MCTVLLWAILTQRDRTIDDTNFGSEIKNFGVSGKKKCFTALLRVLEVLCSTFFYHKVNLLVRLKQLLFRKSEAESAVFQEKCQHIMMCNGLIFHVKR
jgi:hypothetical protein